MGRRRRLIATVTVIGALVVAAGLYWFQPWKLWVDRTVHERLPAVALDAGTASTPASAPAAPREPRSTPVGSATPAVTSSARPGATLLARGRLISHEHRTSGTIAVVRQADGSRVLAVRGLDTSDGPDVEVWLSDQPVRTGEAGWYVFDDGAHVSLGDLKGNVGDQLYRIPNSVDLGRFTSVSLWCARFDVSFGAAELRPAG